MGVNSQVAEAYFKWMDLHTTSTRELAWARNNAYWWALFRERNAWRDQQAAAARRRYARGHTTKDPDDPQAFRPKPVYTMAMRHQQP